MTQRWSYLAQAHLSQTQSAGLRCHCLQSRSRHWPQHHLQPIHLGKIIRETHLNTLTLKNKNFIFAINSFFFLYMERYLSGIASGMDIRASGALLIFISLLGHIHFITQYNIKTTNFYWNLIAHNATQYYLGLLIIVFLNSRHENEIYRKSKCR